MKRLMLIILTLLIIPFTALATVIDGIQNDTNLKLKYPLVYLDNAVAQESINTDIANYVVRAKSLYYDKKMYTVDMGYEIFYEDQNVLSIVINQGWYNGQGAHGYHVSYGLVYDKNTGNRIPLYHYVKISSGNQLRDLIPGGIVKVFNENGKRLYPNQLYGMKNMEASDNYALLGDGIIVLFYQPYVLSAYANGVNSVTLNNKAIEYLNRLNK